jgi:sec-independent protein translocase protein TatC
MVMGMKVKRQTKNHGKSRPNSSDNRKLPFIEHLYELRKRLFYVALSVGLWGAAAYFVQQQIVAALLKPAHNQQFIYTSVGGGINFLFQVCIYAGIVMSIPVIIYHVLKYLQPLIKRDAVRFIAWGSAASGVLALLGMTFGYFIGLPAALHFLLHQFTTKQIHALLTIQSYMSFVTLYMLGSALLFQLPLILILINRIKPLNPKKLLHYERWVILIAFIGGGIMNPSPRIQDQLLLAGPMIIAYQIGILLIWLINRHSERADWLSDLLTKDDEARAVRRSRFAQAQAALEQQRVHTPAPVATAVPVRPAIISQPSPQTAAAQPHPRPAVPRVTAARHAVRQSRRFSDFTVPPRRSRGRYSTLPQSQLGAE